MVLGYGKHECDFADRDECAWVYLNIKGSVFGKEKIMFLLKS